MVSFVTPIQKPPFQAKQNQMRKVLEAIVEWEQVFKTHPVILEMKEDSSPERLTTFASGLSFWVLCFQDILRLNEKWTANSQLREVARGLKEDDRGHDEWFKHDLRVLGVLPDTNSLFRQRNLHVPTRDNTYQIISKLYHAPSDWARMGAMLALEACGRVFFQVAADYAKRAVPLLAPDLKWLADNHANSEASHDIWQDETISQLSTEKLFTRIRSDALRLSNEVGNTMINTLESCWSAARVTQGEGANLLDHYGTKAQ